MRSVIVQWQEGSEWRGGAVYGTGPREFAKAEAHAKAYARGEWAQGMPPTRARIVSAGDSYEPRPAEYEKVYEIEQH